MLFARRLKPTLSQKLRTALWPRRSFARSLRYFAKRVLRLRASPHAIAAGFAAGAFAAFTPLIGFHFLLAFAIAYCVAGNMASAALGTMLGNPLTLPLIWGATYEVGDYLLNANAIDGNPPEGLAHALEHRDFAAIWKPVLEPMLVGSIPLGLGVAALAYAGIFLAARSFQARRVRQVAARQGPSAPLPAGGAS
ncbi:DUF2062 domain-containing protein [Aurantimonas sp. Leaf443]|uniref:DUF2062 domain-containing protein n=1 Tax=Aurantimonas sp. Leaf443 TaxID=1736378 RepID=UPI0007001E2A|nr:DUF2062 domain-containing protein [Aurantimonas sp. Leaf443]KQT88281.1 hypothetical protein ASG48_02310 [Aurantimonas sp. Leaf443]